MNMMTFRWLGQMGFAIRIGGVTLYIDAYLSGDAHRLVPPVISPADTAGTALFFGTHDHMDHIDRAVWSELAERSPEACFIVPEPSAGVLPGALGIPKIRFTGIADGETIEAAGVRVTGIAAAHEFLERDPVSDCHLHMGYIIESGGFRIYHAGDTCIYDGLRAKLLERGPLDLACLPINGRDGERYRRGCIGNMTWQEAADLAGDLRARLTVPGHWDMFRGNTEDPAKFADYMDAKYPNLAYMIPRHGEIMTIYS